VERWLVRVVGAATFVAGAAVAARATPPRPLPGWALSSRFVFGLAVALAVIGPICLLLTLAVQTIVRGRVPTAISREGLTWSEEATANGEAALVDLQLEIDRLAADLANLATGVVASERSQALGSER
jgi:hypothetical protein